MTLPTGWRTESLTSLCLPIKKLDPALTGRDLIRYVDIGSVDGNRHSLIDASEVASSTAPSRCRQLLRGGDTVFSTVRPYLEKIAYIDDQLDGEFASTGFCVLRPGKEVVPKYLFYFATSRLMLDQILPLQKGVSYPAVLDKEVRRIVMPLPPLVEQQRIVDVLEGHLSRLEVACASIEVGTQRLGALRRSVLAGLHRGVSTPLGELAIEAGYGTSAKCVKDGPGAPVVRIPNVLDGRINLDDEKRIADPPSDWKRYALSPGDLLIVRTNGSVDLIGRSAVVQPGINAAFASYLIRFRLDETRVRPDWVQAMLSSPKVRARVESLAASSAGQHNLSLGKLNPIHLPVPSLADQDAGLRRLAELGDQERRLRAALGAASIRATRLRTAILRAAFSGRLTTAGSGASAFQERTTA